MKRLRSSDDLEAYADKDSSAARSSRSSHHGKSENSRKWGAGFGTSSFPSSRHDRDRSTEEDGREASREQRRRPDHEFDGLDRRKALGLGFGRHGGREGYSSSASGESVHRSSGREFPTGFRSERERSRKEGSGTMSWRRFGCATKESLGGSGRECGKEERTSSKGFSKCVKRDGKSPTRSRDSGSEQSRDQSRGVIGKTNDHLRSTAPIRSCGRDDEKRKSKSSPSWSKDSESEQLGESKSFELPKTEELEAKNSEVEIKNPDLEIEEGELEQEDDAADEQEGCKTIKESGDELDDYQTKCEDGAAAEQVKVVNNCEVKESGVNVEGEAHNGADTSRTGSKDDDGVQEKGFDLEEKMDGSESNKKTMEETERAGVDDAPVLAKDKGKRIIPSTSDMISVKEIAVDDMEDHSMRGFELFSSSPVRRVADQAIINREKDEKLKLEPLDLSLSLPNILLPIGAGKDSVHPPGSPSQGRSVQSLSSFRTNSDGFAPSMSISGSQSFFHNPSCSLTQTSLDIDNYEQSVHSRAIFQGLDQSNLQNDSKLKDIPLRILGNGNGFLCSSKIPKCGEKQLSSRSPAQSVGSHDVGSTYSFEKKRSNRDKHGGRIYRGSSQKDEDSLQIGGSDFVDNVVGKIVSDPFYIMARKFHDMPPHSASILKETISEMFINTNKKGQISVFQTALRNRTDLTLDNLLKCHHTQLEILVALKTGIKDYLQADSSFSISDLAEVFLNLRCRNPSCRSHVPVDECECKVCSKKTGFCSACMCLVCSKFDTASNTCSWIGCDVCLHWCHADCALRESFIRNGRNSSGVQGSPEMQFHCVACDHPSEMFGFVKEVFQTFAKEWSADRFSKELEYVRRIFNSSKDPRGRRLYEIADQMFAKLIDKSNLPDVYRYTMNFLTESDSSNLSSAPAFPSKEQDKVNNGIVAVSRQDPSRCNTVVAEVPRMNRSTSLLPAILGDMNEKSAGEFKAIVNTERDPIFAEIESIVRLKLAEADIFQARADDATREAEGLRRIAFAKSENINEEFNKRLAKLRLPEAEEIRKHKYEEFQALERAHREFTSMKMRMEADIEDLLLKMESTKRNLPA